MLFHFTRKDSPLTYASYYLECVSLKGKISKAVNIRATGNTGVNAEAVVKMTDSNDYQMLMQV